MNIVSFDFDGTLFHTSEPVGGKEIFKNKMGIDWPYSGWWSKPETLNLDIFPTPINGYVHREYVKWSSDPESIVILATGRIERIRKEVENVLNFHGLEFDSIHLNPGMETFLFKSKLFEKYIKEYNPTRLIMYDDRQEHLHKFGIWGETQKCEIHIIDVIRKTTKIINQHVNYN